MTTEMQVIEDAEECINFTFEEFSQAWADGLSTLASYIEDDRLEYVQRRFLDNQCYCWHSAIEYTEKMIRERAVQINRMLNNSRPGDEVYEQKVQNLMAFIETLQQQVLLYQAMLDGALKVNPDWRPPAQGAAVRHLSGVAYEAQKKLEELGLSGITDPKKPAKKPAETEAEADESQTPDRTHPDLEAGR